MAEDLPWELVNSTPGRAFRLALPPDLTSAQIEFIRARLPKVWRLQRAGEPVGSTAHDPDFEQHRRLIADHGRLRLEVMELEQRKAALGVAVAQLERNLEARRARAKSFGAALNDLLAHVELPDLDKVKK